LADAADAEDAEDAVEHDFRLRFLPGFARRPFFERLAQFQISGGKGPETAPRLDRAPAHQDGITGNDHRADDYLGVLVGNVATVGADHALAVIALGYATDELRHG
jgi:hypothetical protein